MAFWSRISESKVRHLYSRFKSVPYGSLLNSTVSQTKPCVSENPFLVFHDKPNGFGNSVRFFAAPIQDKQTEEKATSGPRINETITAEVVRLVLENEHIIVPRQEALNHARKLNLDLVEVQGNAVPPVCKIMDFNKEKYQKKLREKDRAKIKSQGSLRLGTIKEIRFSGKTEQKDLQMKAEMVKRLMEQGYRVKCTAKGSPRQELSATLSRLTSLSELLEDVAVVESGPHMGSDSSYMMVRHVKFGQLKKGGKKNQEVASNSNPAIDSCDPTQDLSPEETGSEAEDEILLDEVDQTMTSSKAMPNKNPIIDFQQAASFQFGTDGSVRHSKQAFDSTKAHTKPSQPEAPDSAENRYKKKEVVNRFATTRGMDDRGRGTRDSVQPQFPDQGRQPPRDVNLPPRDMNFSPRDSVRVRPRFPDQGRQPTRDMNFSPQMEENKPAETKAPVFRNSKLPLNDSSKQEPSRPDSRTTPRPSYGIFSCHNANAPEKQGVAGEPARNSVR